MGKSGPVAGSSFLSASLALAAVAMSGGVLAQPDFPNRPVRIVVPQAAGASLDIAARTVGQRMRVPTRSSAWKQWPGPSRMPIRW
jgi:tripartite-type tricarboxylate transporter receptor subunit TctC